MYRYLAAIAALALIGCGTEGSGDTETTLAPKAEQPEAVEQVDTSAPGHALAVGDLPECTDDNLHQLVYLTSEEQFYTCDGDWQVIEIKTEVVTTETTKVADMLWQDEVTGRHWFYRGMTNNYMGCGGSGFVTPGLEDIQEAVENGLFDGVNVNIYYAGNAYINTKYPETERTDYSGSLYGFSLCYVN